MNMSKSGVKLKVPILTKKILSPSSNTYLQMRNNWYNFAATGFRMPAIPLQPDPLVHDLLTLQPVHVLLSHLSEVVDQRLQVGLSGPGPGAVPEDESKRTWGKLRFSILVFRIFTGEMVQMFKHVPLSKHGEKRSGLRYIFIVNAFFLILFEYGKKGFNKTFFTGT